MAILSSGREVLFYFIQMQFMEYADMAISVHLVFSSAPVHILSVLRRMRPFNNFVYDRN